MKYFTDIHAVTRDGKIWSSYYNKFIATEISDSGYVRVLIRTKSIKKNYKVHRLVATAYIPNPKNLPEVNHKNGDKTDNRVENLEWCNRQENMDHSVANGLHKPKHKLTALNRRMIRAMKKDGIHTAKIARALNISYDATRDYVRGKNYLWDPFKI